MSFPIVPPTAGIPSLAPQEPHGQAPTAPLAPTHSPVVPPVSEPPRAPEERLEFSREAFNARLERERVKTQSEYLKSLGFDSPEDFQTFRKQAEEISKAREEEELAKLSEIERIKLEVAERDKRIAEMEMSRQSAIAEAERAKVEIHLQRLFSAKGITEPDYALFRLETELNKLKDGESLDESVFLDGLLADPKSRFALGVPGEIPSGAVSPMTTTTPATGPEPRPPQPGTKHASQMSPEEWAAFKKQNHLY